MVAVPLAQYPELQVRRVRRLGRRERLELQALVAITSANGAAVVIVLAARLTIRENY